jgi:hypothetical protein
MIQRYLTFLQQLRCTSLKIFLTAWNAFFQICGWRCNAESGLPDTSRHICRHMLLPPSAHHAGQCRYSSITHNFDDHINPHGLTALVCEASHVTMLTCYYSGREISRHADIRIFRSPPQSVFLRIGAHRSILSARVVLCKPMEP